MHLGDIISAVANSGLALRGGFNPGPDDGAPAGIKTLVLLGNAGRDKMWAAFTKDRRAEENPLDAWSERTLSAIAQRLGAVALYPFQQPYLPFQQWAQKAEPVYPSPLGALVDIRVGLWHGYRGALGFAEDIFLPPREEAPNPCAACTAKPCTTTCPVKAIGDGAYRVEACVAHLKSPDGAACLEGGCLARRACPVGAAAAYGEDQMRFHMAAFLKSLSC